MDRFYKYFQKANPNLRYAYDGVYYAPVYSNNAIPVSVSDILPSFGVPVSVGRQYETGFFVTSM